MQSAPKPKRVIFGIAGGTAHGKTRFAEALAARTEAEFSGKKKVIILSMDNFYKEIDPSQGDNHNWDDPDSFDVPLLVETLRNWKEGKDQKIAKHDFSSYKQIPNAIDLPATDVLILEGIYAFYHPEVFALIDNKVFVDCDSDTALARRITRDQLERGYGLELILKRYFAQVKPAYEFCVSKQKKTADLLVFNSGERPINELKILDILESYIRYISLPEENK